MVISSSRVLIGSSLVPRTIEIEDGKIISINETNKADNTIIIPGFFDIHTHGGDMIDVNHIESYEDVNKLSRFFASKGVTSFLASVMTDTKETTERILKILRLAIERGVDGARLEGIHLEGPFLSLEYKGAMAPELILDGDPALFDHYQEISGNNILYITIAPEGKCALDLIKHIKREDRCKVSIGHSAAEYETAIEAIENGAVASTHTFNAMKLFHMHRPAISGAVLERDEVYTEVIADGFHLHPATVRLILKIKGNRKVIAITDSIMAAGLPDGNYKLGVNDVVVKNGDAQLLNGVRAGSTLTMDRAMRNIIKFTQSELSYISPLLSENAATMLGLDRGAIKVGYPADFVVLDNDLNLLETYVSGRKVYTKE
ncbi:N-acetylglucosamine-6-phosphate deacetylase [Bullifex porci]|uniref:N-acetylglucosamine-6-phosphate deacetylase n=1 Tax=Bullifex porci TaxID=2606638 RepID=UPI0023F378A4|nr:N-acetylglucosamine-6-phosphate deacetylase [Bullifex porci]MDD7589003.1 N-acetylglucosamine-6-phosphate deacetylase [Bullifex porci]